VTAEPASSGRLVPLAWTRFPNQTGDTPEGPQRETSRKTCKDDVDQYSALCTRTCRYCNKERMPGSSDILWFFFAAGAAVLAALWVAIRMEQRLGLASAPPPNAPAAQHADWHPTWPPTPPRPGSRSAGSRRRQRGLTGRARPHRTRQYVHPELYAKCMGCPSTPSSGTPHLWRTATRPANRSGDVGGLPTWPSWSPWW
jgi:hypothetical protein